MIRSFVKKKKLEERKKEALKKAKAAAEMQGVADEIKLEIENGTSCPFPFVVKRNAAAAISRRAAAAPQTRPSKTDPFKRK